MVPYQAIAKLFPGCVSEIVIAVVHPWIMSMRNDIMDAKKVEPFTLYPDATAKEWMVWQGPYHPILHHIIADAGCHFFGSLCSVQTRWYLLGTLKSLHVNSVHHPSM